MYWTTSIALILGLLATVSLEATGQYLRRRYKEDEPFATSYLKPSYSRPVAVHPSMSSKNPSRRFSIMPSTSLRIRPPSNTGPKFTSSFSIRPLNAAGIGPHGYRNIKRRDPPVIQTGRLRPTPPVRPNPLTSSSPMSSELKPNEIPENVKIKPVYEEGMLPKIPLYINAFPESSQSKSQISPEVAKTMSYEPLGTYAKF